MAKVRSPNYPALGLPDAIAKADMVYKKEHTHKASQEVIAKAMGYSGLNGSSMVAISALRKFGLLEESGDGLKISKDALTILVDPKDSIERAKAIQRAAFLPALFADFKSEYGSSLPSDENIRAFLIKRGFSPSTVDAPIRTYRDTLSLVTELQKVYSGDQANPVTLPAKPPEPKQKAEVGDLIQWESNGVLAFATPKRVRAVQQHEGADWVFVDGSETGIPMSEVLVEQKVPPAVPKPLMPPTLMEAPTAALRPSSGEREWLRGPLSKDSNYRLIVSGELGPKELGKLIKLLEAQKAVLSDDDEEA